MTLRPYLILMTVGASLCWLAWFFVVRNIDPFETTFAGLCLFYLSLFFALVGTFSIVGFFIRRLIIKHDDIVFRHVRHTFRQSIIIASLFLIALLLRAENLLTWWNAIILIIFFVLCEGVIFANRKYSNAPYGI